MAKLLKKSRLTKAIEKDLELSKAFNVAFIPFFKDHPPLSVYYLFNNLKGFICPKTTDYQDIRYFLFKMENVFLKFAAINGNWKGFKDVSLKSIFNDAGFKFPLFIIEDLQKILSSSFVDEVGWTNQDVLILNDLQKALMKCFFAITADKRELIGEEERYLVGEDLPLKRAI